MDERLGPRIACESELGNIGKINWSFDKLGGVKADIKILIFEWPSRDDQKLPPKGGDEIHRNISPRRATSSPGSTS